MANIIVSAQGVSKSFIRKRADSNIFFPVKELDLDICEGQLVVLSGPSGSGKSTLLNMLAGILEPTTGNVNVLDTDIYKLSDKDLSRYRNEHIGVIPQGQSAISSLNVYENILLPYTMYHKSATAEVKDKVASLMLQMGIEELSDIKPSELSGGELRRMAIARSLVCDPKLILADEPTSDLDKENSDKVSKILRDVANSGKAVFVVTHDEDAFESADIKYEMRDGTLTKK